VNLSSEPATGLDVVTGAFGYTGSFIAERLVADGRQVRTLTRRAPGDHPLRDRIEAVPLRFDDPPRLVEALHGVDVLYNTFWRRFPDPKLGFRDIVDQSRILVGAAAEGRARRLVHVSVSNASADAPTSYFVAKAEVEEIVKASGLSYAILRPTLLHGPGDILINNLAWTLRRLPVFGMPGDGSYRVQPVFVGDVADLAIRLGGQTGETTVDAAGPEIFRFVDLVRVIRDRIGARSLVVGLPRAAVLAATGLLGRMVGDVVLTRDEIVELTSELLVSKAEPTCPTPFSTWLEREREIVGRRYASELRRNYAPPGRRRG
jgi:NADH dehydrogenase